ncbi:hypothetical protein Ddc_10302 [Ditylenchus destructor]|nr:hypothetical protein Ddc_10302 [Ditylenchus destructor]
MNTPVVTSRSVTYDDHPNMMGSNVTYTNNTYTMVVRDRERIIFLSLCQLSSLVKFIYRLIRKGSEVPAPEAHPEGHHKEEHNPYMEIAKKLDDVVEKFWKVYVYEDNPDIQGIWLEAMEKVEELAEEIRKGHSMNHQDMAKKAKSALSGILELKLRLAGGYYEVEADTTEWVKDLVKLRDEILKKVNALPKQ